MPFATPSFYTINNDVSCKLASQLCKQPLLSVLGLRLEVSETLSWTLRPPSGPPLGALWTVAGAPERLWGCSWTCLAASLAPLEPLLGTKTAISMFASAPMAIWSRLAPKLVPLSRCFLPVQCPNIMSTVHKLQKSPKIASPKLLEIIQESKLKSILL